MAGRLFLLFLIVPVLELTLLVTVGQRIGLGPTLGIVLTTALTGAFLARREGLATWRRLQQTLASGGLPGDALVDGMIVLVAAALMLTPGFLTDVAGLAGLFPPTRRLIRGVLQRRFSRGVQSGSIRVARFGPPGFASPGFGPPGFGPPPVEDAEVIDDGARAPDREDVRG